MKTNERPFKKIKSVSFGLLGPSLIKKYGTVHVNQHHTQNKKIPHTHGVYSPWMGTIQRGLLCIPCKQDLTHDSGHMGYTELILPMYNRQTRDTIKQILSCICFYCRRIKLRSDPDILTRIINSTPDKKKRLQLLVKYSKSIHICGNKKTGNKKEDVEADEAEESDAKEDDDDEDDGGCGDSKKADEDEEEDGEEEDGEGEESGGDEEDDTECTSPSVVPEDEDEKATNIDNESYDELEKQLLGGDDEDGGEEKGGKKHSTTTKKKRKRKPTTTTKEEGSMKPKAKIENVATAPPIPMDITAPIKSCAPLNGCRMVQPKYKLTKDGMIMAIFHIPLADKQKKTKSKFPAFNTCVIHSLLSGLSDEDIQIFGMDPVMSRPSYLLFTVLPIMPPGIRPSSIKSEGNRIQGHDDLTLKLQNIEKINNLMIKKLEEDHIELPLGCPNMNAQYWWESTTSKTKTLCTCTATNDCVCKLGSLGKAVTVAPSVPSVSTVGAKRHPKKEKTLMDLMQELQIELDVYQIGELQGYSGKGTERLGRPIRSIRARLISKKGLLRNNVMGKRQNGSARTVIIPDPYINVDQIGFPAVHAKILTYPMRVTRLNLSKCRRYLRRGKVNFIKLRTGKMIDTHYINIHRHKIHIGDIVFRHLEDGDVVLMNRQPSLHAPSIMAKKVKVIKGQRTFGLHPLSTEPFNADFDGDEMNIWVPQDELTRAEALELLSTENYIVWAQSSKAIMSMKLNPNQSAFYMTHKDTFFTYDDMCQYSYQYGYEEQVKREIPPPCIWTKTTRLWSGKQLFSLFLPDDFQYGDCPSNGLDHDRKSFFIDQGDLLVGQVTKDQYGGKPGGIIHSMYRDYSPRATMEYMSGMERVLNLYLEHHGITIKPSDVAVVSNSTAIVAKGLKWTDELDSLSLKGHERENHILTILDHVRRYVGQSIVKSCQSTLTTNGLFDIIDSGTKAEATHLAQLMGCLGQQKLFGNRMSSGIPHYNMDSSSSRALGFIVNNFINGLSPEDYFFHSMCGREGVVDTAAKTSRTGYIQRRLSKALENLGVKYGGTVTDANGQVFSFLYGGDGWDATHLEYITCRLLLGQVPSIDVSGVTEETAIRYATQDKTALTTEWQNLHHVRQFCLYSSTRSLSRVDRKPELYLSPIPYKRLLAKANKLFPGPGTMTPVEVLQETQALWKELCFNHHIAGVELEVWSSLFTGNKIEWASGWGKKEIYSTLEILFRDWLFPCSLALTPLKWQWIKQRISHYVAKALAQPGLTCGMIAAQCIGEPATQMTLRTFHSAGASSLLVLGVPRLDEILKCALKQISPAMFLVLVKDTSQDQAQQICKRLISRSLGYYIKSRVVERLNTPTSSEWCPIRIILTVDQEKCDEVHFLLAELVHKLVQYFIGALKIVNASLLSESVLIDIDAQKRIYIRFNSGVKYISQFYAAAPDKQHEDAFWEAFTQRILMDLIVHGLEGITNAFISQGKVKVFTDGGVLHEKRWTIETAGSNFGQAIILPMIDYQYCTTTVIHEMLEEFDIEAARLWIIDNIDQTMSETGAHVVTRHIDLLSRVMTHYGRLTEISHKGISNQDDSTLRSGAFENSMEHFKNGAIFNKKDPLNGVTECVIMSNTCKCGTGLTHVVLDAKKQSKAMTIEEQILTSKTSWARATGMDILNREEMKHAFMVDCDLVKSSAKKIIVVAPVSVTLEEYVCPNSPRYNGNEYEEAVETIEPEKDFSSACPYSPTNTFVESYDPENPFIDTVVPFIPSLTIPAYLQVASPVCGVCMLNSFAFHLIH